MILKTGRLVLRPMAMADAPALFAILGDPEAMASGTARPAPAGHGRSPDGATNWPPWRRAAFYYWTVLKDGDAIGSMRSQP